MTKSRRLGSSTFAVNPIGLGCMGMSEFYGRTDDAESLATMHRAVELGVDFFDTSDMYGIGHNESLVGRFLREAEQRVVVGTKFGIVRDPASHRARILGTPEYVRQACEASLKRLGIDTIDLYYYHRVDREVPIEETVGAMGELVARGLVRAIGLSEVSAESIRRAHAIAPVAAVQSEYSLWTREQEEAVIPTCRELGIAFVAYSPLGRGFLAGKIKGRADLSADDLRSVFPRFQEANLAQNRELLASLESIAARRGATAAQVALAWVLARGEDILALAGTKRRGYLEENVGGGKLALDGADIALLDQTFGQGRVAGERYPAMQMSLVNG